MQSHALAGPNHLQTYLRCKRLLSTESGTSLHSSWLSSGNIWGWITQPTQHIESLKQMGIKVESDPFTTNIMKFSITDSSNRIVNRIEIPWDPSLHKREMYYRSIKLKNPVQLKVPTDLSDRAKSQFIKNREALSFAEPRLIEEIRDGKKPFTQSDWYLFEHAKARYDFLSGNRQINSLYELLEYGWIDPEFFAHVSEFRSVNKFNYHRVQATWIETGTETEWPEQVELGLDALLLDLRRHKEIYGPNLDEKPFAHSVHIENAKRPVNFHFLDLNALKETEQGTVDTQWLNVHSDLQNFIANTYQKELGMSQAETEKLNAFSTQNSHRIQYFMMSEEPFSIGKPLFESIIPYESRYEETFFKQDRELEHFTLKASMGIIYSNDPLLEPLSLEKYGNITINRKPGEKVAELIRLGIDPNERDLGAKLMWKMSSYIVNGENVSRVFAITSKDYAEQLVKNFGFEKVTSRISPRGTEEWVIQITPSGFFERSAIHPPGTH